MVVRQLSILAWLGLAGVAALAVTGSACSSQEAGPPPKSAALPAPQTFRFAPPDGTHYVRIDRRKRDVSIVGTALRRTDEEELQWKVAIRRNGNDYSVTQDLVHLAYKRDGQVLAQGTVAEGTIAAELVIDHDGNLTEVRGLEKAAATLRALASPGQEQEAARMLTPQYLADIISTRYTVMYGETIGREATPGASWTIAKPPGSFVSSRKVTVERQEPCENATCARLRVDFTLDPHAIGDVAVALVKIRVAEAGGDPSKIVVKSASYGMSGAMLVEPTTMLNHGAMLAEAGTISLSAPNQDFTVDLKGTTEVAYVYGATAPVATRPAAQNEPVAAKE
jgi:hypothetical protein